MGSPSAGCLIDMLGNRWCIARPAPRARLTLRIWQTKTPTATASRIRMVVKVQTRASVRTQVLKIRELDSAKTELKAIRALRWTARWKNNTAVA